MEQYLYIFWNEINKFLFNGITGIVAIILFFLPRFLMKQNKFLILVQRIGEAIILLIIAVLLLHVMLNFYMNGELMNYEKSFGYCINSFIN